MNKTAYPNWQDKPFRLDLDEIENPYQVVDRFFDDRTLPEHRAILWELLSAALSGSSAECFTAREGGEWVLYFRELEELIEASYIIYQNNQKKPISTTN